VARQPRILVSPLNWGLGHASRCVPIIRELLKQGVDVVIGAEEHPKALLNQEFPSLEAIEFPGYQITYPSGGNMAVHMLKIMPKILNGIKKEHAFLMEVVKEYGIDGIISDNRFGLYHDQIPSVFITHQVMIKSPYGEALIQKLNGRFMNKYTTVWIPDFEGEENLSGDLAHQYSTPPHAQYIGPLSRFEQLSEPDNYTYDVLAVISGPEPQRTLFQHILQTELEMANVKALMVLGKADTPIEQEIEGITIRNHLNAEELNQAFQQSKIVIARSGYSTLMDLAATGKRAILIPTPGQTEQEYLADLHLNAKRYFSIDQDRFDLDEALTFSKGYDGINLPPDSSLLQNAIADFLARIAASAQ